MSVSENMRGGGGERGEEKERERGEKDKERGGGRERERQGERESWVGTCRLDYVWAFLYVGCSIQRPITTAPKV